MAVDDHAIDSLRTWFEIAYAELKREYLSGEYAKLFDCPSYEETACYRVAMNILIKGCYYPEYAKKYELLPLKRALDEEIKTERFWEKQKNCTHKKTEIMTGEVGDEIITVILCKKCGKTLERKSEKV